MNAGHAAARLLADLAEGFRGHAGRYALAAFAVSVGIMAFALLVLIVNGLDQRVREITDDFGADVVSIVREDALSGRRQGLSLLHVEAIRANFPDLVVAPLRFDESRPIGGGDPVTVIATEPDLVAIRGWSIRQGRNLDVADLAGHARVLLASRHLDETAGWSAGRVVVLDDTPFFIAGVVDAQAPRIDAGGAGTLANLGERFVLAPWSAVPSWRGRRGDDARRVDQVLLRGGEPEGVVERVRALFTQPGLDPGHVSWVTAQRLVADIERLKRVIALSVGAVASLCLVLGGTTLMSLMVLNVRERLPEIGLRLSLGARRSQVSMLFVVEALVVTLTAGAAGTVAAHALAGLVGQRLPLSLEAGWASIVVPSAVALLLGAVFSWWPARLAARISPAEALRAE